MHIACQVFGDGGYDLILNNGCLSNVDANWDVPEQRGYMEALARQARVIVFDRRGFGVSDRPTSPEQMTLEKGMDDMRAVLDAAGSERAVVHGFETGGAVRAVFLLREVFGFAYDEVAGAVHKTEGNCRQIAARARRHVEARRPRFEASRRQKEELAKVLRRGRRRGSGWPHGADGGGRRDGG